jgi:hypothetical protein
MQFFSEDYFEASARFASAASRAGLEVEALWHPSATAPDGRRLAVDVARAGAKDASHVLFTVCGTHGVEGYAGSAAQLQLLRKLTSEPLPPHIAIVLVHGLNPYGWARNSQRNEDGIDLNRNFIDFSQIPEGDAEGVSLMSTVLDIPEMSFAALGHALEKLAAIRKEIGAKRYIQRVAGQYLDPRGFKYGGSRPSWSNQVYRDIVRRYLKGARYVAEVEWHTGLGAYGEFVPLCFAHPDSPEFERTCDWWGVEAVRGGLSVWSPGDATIQTPNYSGLTHAALMEEAPDAVLAGGVVEFGTMPLNQISLVPILDHWMTFNAADDADLGFWRTQMRTFMAPRDPGWEASVLRHAERLYSRALHGLAGWGA